MTVERRLAELGLALPSPPVPVGNYIPAAQTGNLVFTSGQTSRVDGVRRYVGVVGRDVTPDDADRSARDATLNCLACVKVVAGDLERIARVVKVVGFVNCPPHYERLSEVIDGASDLLKNVLGDRGQHVRTIIAGGSLPSNASPSPISSAED
ncbi:MAG TPA: RidA family protein [Methylomirabilota bacterium]|nr:RidA family protein [Methylomirabilota bacterium]